MRVRALIKRTILFVLVALAVFVGTVAVSGWTAFGTSATGARLERMMRSPQYQSDHFVNPEPMWNDNWGVLEGLWNASRHGAPRAPVPVQRLARGAFDLPPASGLRLTWFGHSSMLLEIDGRRVLVDPMWGQRSSPLTWLGPQRWYEPPIALADLPAIDAVLISHDHYDHLDLTTILAIKDWDTIFVVPLGVGAHLAYWGVPESRIVELDWWDETMVKDLRIVATPARHASGRTLLDKDETLWAGFAIIGATHRAYYSGDTGLFPALSDIGDRLGPFDLTLIEAGQYNPAWPDWHIGPEQAVRAHQMVRGRVLVPVHWGLFELSFHSWTEPVERVAVAARKAGVTVLTPRPGELIEPGATAPAAPWWPKVPGKTAEESPVVSTKVPPP